MKRFEKLIKGYKPFTIFPKTSILDVRNISKYNSKKWKLMSEAKNTQMMSAATKHSCNLMSKNVKKELFQKNAGR